MRIKHFVLNEPGGDLKPIAMRGLGSVVALIGKNGSGKSRVINELMNYPYAISSIGSFGAAFEFGTPLVDTILREARRNNPESNPEESLRSYVLPRMKRIETEKYKQRSSQEDIPNFSRLFHSKEMLDLDVNVSSNLITDGMLSIATPLLKEDYLIYRQGKKEDDTIYYKHFSRLKYWVARLLNTEINFRDIGLEPDMNVQFNGTMEFTTFPYKFELLSPGQRILLSLAFYISLFESKTKLNAEECIFIIDEPETHLHPSVQVDLIKALKGIVKDKGQLWIATHSIHILAELNYDEIYLVKEGEVFSPNRTRPAQALAELMGIQDNIDKVNEFIFDTTKWVETNFLVECLGNPQVFSQANLDDPEINIFVKSILNDKKIDILDFGAGKGRLALALKDADESVKNKINSYNAFEPFENEISAVVGTIPFGSSVFKDIKKLSQDVYDLAVFIGVVHEIQLSLMIEYLNRAIMSLKDEGALLIIEDLYFPKGELPNEDGYFVFNSVELEVLFNQPHNSSKPVIADNPKYANRIEGTLFLKKNRLEVSDDSLRLAIIKLRDRVFSKIKEFKKIKNDVADGRLYAFYCQQYINCQKVLETENNDIPWEISEADRLFFKTKLAKSPSV